MYLRLNFLSYMLVICIRGRKSLKGKPIVTETWDLVESKYRFLNSHLSKIVVIFIRYSCCCKRKTVQSPFCHSYLS